MSAGSAIVVDVDGPLMRVVVNRPDRANALDRAALRDLAAVFESLSERPAIRVVTLRGAGPSFCTGVDLAEPGTDHPDAAAEQAALSARAVAAVTAAPAVTLARVHGAATGLGLSLAVACDLRLADEDAVFRLPELYVRQPPCWGDALTRLVAEIGPARARELVLLGERVDAATATRYGLVNRTGPTELIDRLESRWTRRLARAAPAGVLLAKARLRAQEPPGRPDDSLTEAELAAVHADQRARADHPDAQRAPW
ncbi:enoyl-CoA hydratase/isomerase family protein [Kitasatospora sp. NPDC049285]|uniref:enoyl-CoA hydratase/isomerase family protein n=1 Tax=Kitasatospora sp. NPDC049285 TaxID=3157096 RepID=UPI003437F958